MINTFKNAGTTALIASALSVSAPAHAHPDDMSDADRITLLETWYETMDYDMLADEVDWTHASGFFGGETLTTREQVKEQLGPFYFEMFDNIEVDIEKIEVSDESVFSFGTYNLTPRNTDEVHEAKFIHVWTIDNDGEIDSLVQYADTALIDRALADARVLSPK